MNITCNSFENLQNRGKNFLQKVTLLNEKDAKFHSMRCR